MTCASMPWFKVASDAARDEKVRRLRVRVGDTADAYMLRLWCYCAEKRQDGRFTGPDAADFLEAVVEWRGEKGALVRAMVELQLLDEVEGGLEVHRWPEWQGPIVAKWEKDRERRATARKQAPRACRATVAGESRDPSRDLPLPISDSRSCKEGVQGEPSAAAPPPAPKPAALPPLEPGAPSLVERLAEAYLRLRGERYGLNALGEPRGKDGMAFPSLLALSGGDESELLRRWENGLQRKTYPRISRLHELEHHWEHCAKPEAQAPPRSTGRTKAQDVDWDALKENPPDAPF